MPEADYKAMQIIARFVLGILAIGVGSCIMAPDHVATIVTLITAVAVPVVTMFLTLVKTNAVVAKIDEAAKVGKDNNAELKVQTEALEAHTKELGAIHEAAATAKVEAVATREEAVAAKEEIIQTLKANQ